MSANETLDDIVRKIREIADNKEAAAKKFDAMRMQHERCRLHPHCNRHADLMREVSDDRKLADRIEAAAKRERETADLRAIHRCHDCERENATPGNASAMREALEAVSEEFSCGTLGAVGDCPSHHDLQDVKAVWRKVEAALAAPPEPPSNAAALREVLMFLVENEAYLFKADLTNGEYDLLEAIVIKARAALAAPARNCDRFGGVEDKLIEACLNERGLLVTENFRDVFSDWLLEPAKGKGESNG